jgi:hypothetical protein
MPNFIKQLALVSETNSIDLAETTRVAAALDKQATRDFAPIWSVSASVHAFASLEEVPLGYWPMIIRDDIEFQGAAGVHLDKDGQPFALITSGADWPLTASHEMLEMLADPFGNRTIAGPSIKPGQGRVNYLVEVSDPSEASEFGYTANDVEVSDFYTPAYFDPVVATGVRYSFTGAISKPREVLKGGYLSWHEPVSDHWFQANFFGSKLAFEDIGRIDAKKGSLRSQIDALTMNRTLKVLKSKKEALTAMASRSSLGAESSAARAKSLTSQMDAVVKKARKANLSS